MLKGFQRHKILKFNQYQKIGKTLSIIYADFKYNSEDHPQQK